MLIGDYEFSHHPQDLGLLTRISQVAAFAHAPFIAAASPKLFNVNQFTEMTDSFDLARLLGGVEYTGWTAFRESEDSRYVALTLPRVLGRQPYGEEFHKVDEFNFEEFVGGKEHDRFLWMNSAWAFAALVTGAFARYGWMAGGGGVKGSRKVEGLPVHRFPCDDGGEAVECSTEMAISDRREFEEFELSNLGFLPLLHRKDGDFAGFLGAQSCQKPKQFVDPAANANAELSAKINYILCVSRFAQCIKVMVRDRIGSLPEPGGCEKWLNDWIQHYCVGDALRAQGNVRGESTEERVQVERDLMDRCPLHQAKVEVRAVNGKPGRYEAVIRVLPHFHYAVSPFVEISIVAELPNQGG
jgi:type VI secretion system protein ImpC